MSVEHVGEELSRQDYIHPDVHPEILYLREEVFAHPERLEGWEGTTERVRARFYEIRHERAKCG